MTGSMISPQWTQRHPSYSQRFSSVAVLANSSKIIRPPHFEQFIFIISFLPRAVPAIFDFAPNALSPYAGQVTLRSRFLKNRVKSPARGKVFPWASLQLRAREACKIMTLANPIENRLT
ncbi:MAG TPA: hypothetical protein VLY20_04930 [Nitrospiria bacterium]|nr:hypothetical protein [Nitrospiria bacterium]